MTRIVDLFAGPGGWDEGLRLLGEEDVVGVEFERSACTTAEAAGHKRLQADVRTIDPSTLGPVEGLIASPPCQAWSLAGQQRGEHDRALVHELVDRMSVGLDDHNFAQWADDRSSLVAEPVRWARDLQPTWIALEEVPAVIGLWAHMAEIFRGWGYSVSTGVLHAEQYGVPQSRKRAILVAHRERDAVLPAPEYQRWSAKPEPELRPYRTMEDELGDRVLGFEWLRSSGQPNAAIRNLDEPCFTFAFGSDINSVIWGPWGSDPMKRRRMLARERPAGSRGISPAEAGALQTFPLDYPWSGIKYRIYEQIGNAVPPVLASKIVGNLLL